MNSIESLDSIQFAIKLKSLITQSVLYYLKFGLENRKLDPKDTYAPKRVLGALLIAGGTSLVIKHLGLKYLPSQLSKKDLEDSSLLRSELIRTHTKTQQNLWDEIKRSQEEAGSVIKIILNSTKKESPTNYSLPTTASSRLSTLSWISSLFSAKKYRELESKSKWLSMQISRYENSLSKNQLVLYKNLFETENKILSKYKVIKSILTIGIPLLLFHVVGYTQKDNIVIWEETLEDLYEEIK